MAESWEVRRDVLLEAITLLNLVPSQSGIPSSDFFLVQQDKRPGHIWMCAAGGAVANVHLDGTGTWPFQKPFYLDRRLFTPFITAFPEIKNKYNFEFRKTAEGALRVRCGKPFEDFSAQPSVMGYGEIPALKNPSKLRISDELMALMRCASQYASSEAEAPHLACVYLTPRPKWLEILATNQKIIFCGKHRFSHDIKSVIPFPIQMLSTLQAEGMSRMVWSAPNVFAQFPRGVVWQSVSAQASKNFPADDLRERLNRKQGIKPAFRASAAKFARVVERLSTYLQYVRKEDWVLNISGTKGSDQIFLVSRLPHATINEHLRVLETIDTNFNFDWPLDQLGGLFKFAGTVDSAVECRLEKDAGMSYVTCGPIEMAMSTRRV